MKRILDWRLLTALLVFVFGMVVTSCGGNPDGGVAVDLGLPSGTLWADRNIGADSPEDCGDYFAWGETEPKTTYNWSTYKWCKGRYGTLTKYCTDLASGTVDNKMTLEPEDDAATTNWGEAWCMPTYEQIIELDDECTWTEITQNGVNGFKLTGPNGNSIFIPAAGIRSNDKLYGFGSNFAFRGNHLVEVEGVLDYSRRYYGIPVRAVRAGK